MADKLAAMNCVFTENSYNIGGGAIVVGNAEVDTGGDAVLTGPHIFREPYTDKNDYANGLFCNAKAPEEIGFTIFRGFVYEGV